MWVVIFFGFGLWVIGLVIFVLRKLIKDFVVVVKNIGFEIIIRLNVFFGWVRWIERL